MNDNAIYSPGDVVMFAHDGQTSRGVVMWAHKRPSSHDEYCYRVRFGKSIRTIKESRLHPWTAGEEYMNNKSE